MRRRVPVRKSVESAVASFVVKDSTGATVFLVGDPNLVSSSVMTFANNQAMFTVGSNLIVKAEVPPDSEMDKLHKAHEARSLKYSIPALPDGAMTPPAGYPTDESMYGDPVNYAYPLDTPERSMNAHTRFAQFHESYAYGKQSIFERIIAAEMKHGAKPMPSAEMMTMLSTETQAKLKAMHDGEKKPDNTVEKSSFTHFLRFKKTATLLEGHIRGVVYPADRRDAHGEAIGREDLRKAAHMWMEDSQEVNIEHSNIVVTNGVRVVESFIAPCDMPEIDAHEGDWAAEFAVKDPALKAEIQKGLFKGFSIEGICDKVRDTAQNVVKMVNLMVTRISLVEEPASMIGFIAKSTSNPPQEVVKAMDNLKLLFDTVQGQVVKIAKNIGADLPADIPSFSFAKSEEEQKLALLKKQAGYVSEVVKSIEAKADANKAALAKALETANGLAEVVETQQAHIATLEQHPDIATQLAAAINTPETKS